MTKREKRAVEAGAGSDIAAVAPKLVVVSNRLPFTVERGKEGPVLSRAPGGLVSALEPVLAERGGVWVGWNGVSREQGESLARVTPDPPAGVRYHPVPLGAREVSRYYEGFSNRTLWPLLHSFVGRTNIDRATWRTYEAVNERFAQAAAAVSTPETLVWIHDYQLLRAPLYLRRLSPESRIALFLHVSFPPGDLFRVLPWAREIMHGMLSADLVGFQVPSHAGHFMSCAARLLGCEVDRAANIVVYEGRAISVQAHPISIDAHHLESLARKKPAATRDDSGYRSVLGVDRLDYTKGIHERLLAVDRLLETHPELRGKFVFTQVLVPSREKVAEYRALKKELDEAVGRINGRWSERGWSPIRYLVRSFPPEELVGLYRQADVALVTPLRDGMNLVAKEFVISHVDNEGVLVLSEFAGASEELHEALLVNPFDVDAVAETLFRALNMAEDEVRSRMSALRDRVFKRDVHAWVRKFLSAADEAADRVSVQVANPVEVLRQRVGPWLAARKGIVLFLDYDGTLSPLAPHPDLALLPADARSALEEAARAPGLDVVIISGRSLHDLKSVVGINDLTYIGNHGFEMEGPGVSFKTLQIAEHSAALEEAALAIERIGVSGAWVERKGATFTLHVRDVAEEDRTPLLRRARSVIQRRGLWAVDAKSAIEARPPVDWHKGKAVLHLLRHRYGEKWSANLRALYLGDDTTDEDAFLSLRGIGRSVRIGASARAGSVQADYLLPNPAAVAQIIRWLATGGFRIDG